MDGDLVKIIDKNDKEILTVANKHIISIENEEDIIVKTDVDLEDIKERFIQEVVEDTVNILLGAAEKVE